MLLIALDAFTLIVLLKLISDEEVSFLGAAGISLLTSIAASVLVMLLVGPLGLLGVLLALLIVAGGLGLVVSSQFGVEIKRSFVISGVFMFVHLAVVLGLTAMRSS